MSKFIFAQDAWEEYLYWKNHDKETFKKINGILREIQKEPFFGEVLPELVEGGYWSRSINKKDRVVYDVIEDYRFIMQCKVHDNDK